MIIYLYLIGFCFLCTIQSSTCDICATCSCSFLTNQTIQINCHGKYFRNNDMLNLDLLTFDDYQQLNKLILSKNHMTILPRNLLTKLTPLKSLDLSENPIEKIYATMFIGLSNLEELNLSKNALKTFDDSILEVLPSLLILNISYNHIDSIEHLYMKKTILKIQMLDFSHNNISNFSTEFSEALPNVRYLDLSFNRIHSLQDCNLTPLNSLEVIYLNNNFLTELNMQILPKGLIELHSGFNQITEILNDWSHIQVLSVEHNKISEIHANFSADNLQYLNIRGNMLSSFSNILFENLRTLDISDNNLTYLPEVISIKNFPMLIELNVSKNPIKNLTVYSDLKLNSFVANNMSMLESIDKDMLKYLRPPSKDCINLTISNNKMLSFIHEDALEHMNLCSLDLSNNRLSYVAQKLTVHNGTSTTSSINLQGNPFKCNCALQWILNNLVPKLYSAQPQLLDNLRCAWPPEISNMRIVHWYGWKDQVFCTNVTHFNENLTMKAAGVTTNQKVELDSSPGLLIVLGIAMTVLTILVVAGIIWTQRIAMRRRRVNRKF